jgi:hypothetical protein
MWLVRRCALTGTTPMLRMDARLTGTTVRAGLLAESLLAPAPGTAAMDVHSIRGPTLAAMLREATDAVSRDAVLMDTLRWSGAASKDAARSQKAAVVVDLEADAKPDRLLDPSVTDEHERLA